MGSNIDIMQKFQTGLTDFSNPKFYEQVLKELDDELVNYQRGQMDKGRTNTGSLIEPKYSPITQILKEKDPRYKISDGKTPNLESTGSFKDALVAQINANIIKFTSLDSKTKELENKYKNIFGFNSVTRIEFINDILLPVILIKRDERFN